MSSERVLGWVVRVDGEARLEPALGGGTVRIVGAAPPRGSLVRGCREDDGSPSGAARIPEPPVAEAGSLLAALYGIALAHGLNPDFPPPVMAEVEALLAAPGLDDPALEDQRDLPYVTIDNEGSRDLDQALLIERAGPGLRLRYALADAAYYVRPGTALFAEALARSASFYLPGLCVPMLPPALSEGIVSLNPGVDRRALVFDIELDEEARVLRTTLRRALIHSRAKLSYPGVQRFCDGDRWPPGPGDPAPSTLPVPGAAYLESLALLRELGEARRTLAEERDALQFQRRTLGVDYRGREAERFELIEETRLPVELWNEQVSLLCNMEGARFLIESGEREGKPLPNYQPIFRRHTAPLVERREELAARVAALVRRRGLPEDPWLWRRDEGEPLARWLARLPDLDAPGGGLALALHTQALLMSARAEFSDHAGRHFALGAPAYARFSSPMREVAGLFTHKEALELLEGHGGEAPASDDVALRDAVIEGANRSKSLQAQLDKAVQELAIDQLFSDDLRLPRAARPLRRGTLCGLGPERAYLLLDFPPIRVKLYLVDLRQRLGVDCQAEDDLLLRGPQGQIWWLGDPVDLRVVERAGRRWLLEPVG